VPHPEAQEPSFEASTIKPDVSGAPTLQALDASGRTFKTRNSSLADLIGYAYGMQSTQIIGGPAWMNQDRYDVVAVADQGVPDSAHFKKMVQALLVERFGLQLHPDQRQLSAYVLTAAKNRSKLTPNAPDAHRTDPGFGLYRGPTGLTLHVRHASMADFVRYLQMVVVDRPVADETELAGKFDFLLTFMPDDSLFRGHPPVQPDQTEASDPAPGLFTAIDEQLGLKLAPEKHSVQVLVVDHVQKPSPN
jgi:uncharacterized protein (TIGR03435 family)